MPHDPPKVLFAAGGTGGHLFPAQALAEKLTGVDILFSGAKLSTNAYFDRNKFLYRDIDSTTPLRGNILQKIQSVVILLRGVLQSLCLLSKERPDLVVGFGSFHSFPLLCAAALKRIPLVLFESNAVPGKVIRLFSRFALYTAVYFPESERYLKGKVHAVEIPSLKSRTATNAQEARRQLGLDPDCFTLLVFGGSQGAKALNSLMLALLPLLKSAQISVQLIHLAGKKGPVQEIADACAAQGITAHVREFEERMDIAWSAADVAICRAGAATLSELIHFAVPAILIPFPYAADQHQLKNARFIEKGVQGAVVMEESSLSPETVKNTLSEWALHNPNARAQLKQNICTFREEQKKMDLVPLIENTLRTK